MVIHNNIEQIFKQKFDQNPRLFRAPGRINLIGEHTDYNEGFVLPASVQQSIYFASEKNNSQNIRVFSVDFEEIFEFSVDDTEKTEHSSWKSYVLGVVAELRVLGYKFSGFDMVFQGEVPQGSGMSSSAALECGTCYAINELFGLGLTKWDIIKASQKAEHNYAGVMCGIMDQFASVMGKEGNALLLDCRSLEFDNFPLKLERHHFILLNSNVTHSLVDSEYNVRRKQCGEGIEILRSRYNKVNNLRDVTYEMLLQMRDQMPNVVFRRCKYVIEENLRVHQFAKAMSNGDLIKAGEILKIAQKAMSEEYEITCPEIDFMADFANNHSAILGSRMMGGGFGGCTINLIRRGEEENFIEEIKEVYFKEFNIDLTPIDIEIADGVSEVT